MKCRDCSHTLLHSLQQILHVKESVYLDFYFTSFGHEICWMQGQGSVTVMTKVNPRS